MQSSKLVFIIGTILLAFAFTGSQVRADFTESEDRPLLDPDGSEDNPLSSAAPVPWDLAPFATAFPDGLVWIRGQLDAGDVDTYAFNPATGDLLLAALFEDADGERLDPSLGIFTGSATPALGDDDDAGMGFLPRLTFPVASSGTHQIAVTGFGDTAFDGSHLEASDGLAPYLLVVASTTATPPLTEVESNDSIAAANILPSTGGVIGATLDAADVDHFSIDLEAGDRLAVSVFDLDAVGFGSAEGELNDTRIALLEPGTGTEVAANDDGGLGFMGNLLFTVPGSGEGHYTIAVTGFGDSALTGEHAEGPFDYFLVVARERACPNTLGLMSGIAVSTSNSYVTAFLEGGDHYYTDRIDAGRHVLVDIPSAYECAQWIKTANNDKGVTDPNHLTFTLSQDASVFIAYDTRATAEPAWLAAGFTPLGEIVDIADPSPSQEFDLLRRDFSAGTVVLGGNSAPGAGSNYSVFALPLPTSDAGQALEIPGNATTVSIEIIGVVIEVNRQTGQTTQELTQVLADAVNANPTLAAARIFGLASGTTFVTTGTIDDSTITAAPPVPTMAPWGVVPIAMFFLATAHRRLRLQNANAGAPSPSSPRNESGSRNERTAR